MNESWRQAEADAHEAKAEALRIAIDTLRGVDGAVDAMLDGQLAATVTALEHEVGRLDRVAALVRAG